MVHPTGIHGAGGAHALSVSISSVDLCHAVENLLAGNLLNIEPAPYGHQVDAVVVAMVAHPGADRLRHEFKRSTPAKPVTTTQTLLGL